LKVQKDAVMRDECPHEAEWISEDISELWVWVGGESLTDEESHVVNRPDPDQKGAKPRKKYPGHTGRGCREQRRDRTPPCSDGEAQFGGV